MSQPSTQEVVEFLRPTAVLVGSYPRKGLYAKAVDFVIRARPRGGADRNPVFEKIRQRWGEHLDSAGPGHLVVRADPQPVAVFENLNGQIDDPIKQANRLTYARARRRAKRITCHGVADVWAVID